MQTYPFCGVFVPALHQSWHVQGISFVGPFHKSDPSAYQQRRDFLTPKSAELASDAGPECILCVGVDQVELFTLVFVQG